MRVTLGIKESGSIGSPRAWGRPWLLQLTQRWQGHHLSDEGTEKGSGSSMGKG